MSTDPSVPSDPSTPGGAPGAPYGSGYPQPGYGAPVPARTNTLSIVGLILGIVVAPAGIVVSIIALSQIKKTGENGRGLAMAGLIIGIVFTLIWIVSIIVSVALAASVSNNVQDQINQLSSIAPS